MPDSSKVGEYVKLTITSLSYSEDYIIKDLKMNPSQDYTIVEQSFSMSLSTKGNEQIKKETVTIEIKVLKEGALLIDGKCFTDKKNEHFSIKGKILNVSP
jgi:hypothetical protein